MIRNLKVLGVALGVVFAMFAVMASGASAVDTFTPENEKADITGTGENGKFEITEHGIEFHCQTVNFSGTIEKGAKQATVMPTYKGTKAEPENEKCESTVGKVKIDMNGCDYVLTGETTGEDPKKSGKLDATVWIVCPAGKQIQITGALGCTISVHEQTPTEGGVVYTNETDINGKKDITVHATATGITYSSTEACGLIGVPSEGNTADYTETVTVKGYVDGAPHDLTHQIPIEYSVS